MPPSAANAAASQALSVAQTELVGLSNRLLDVMAALPKAGRTQFAVDVVRHSLVRVQHNLRRIEADLSTATLAVRAPAGLAPALDAGKAELRFFSYNPDIGTLLHPTAQDAREAANLAIAHYREAAQCEGECPGDVEQVCWGEIHGWARAEGDENGADYRVSAESPVAAAAQEDDLTVTALAKSNLVDAGKVRTVMTLCGLDDIALDQRLDVNAVARLLNHLLSRPAAAHQAAA